MTQQTQTTWIHQTLLHCNVNEDDQTFANSKKKTKQKQQQYKQKSCKTNWIKKHFKITDILQLHREIKREKDRGTLIKKQK